MKQVSISFVRSIERLEDGSYKVTLSDETTTIETGVVDSIYHDGKNRTTFTVTFNA